MTIYKQDESAFVGKLQRGCDAEASGECSALLSMHCSLSVYVRLSFR